MQESIYAVIKGMNYTDNKKNMTQVYRVSVGSLHGETTTLYTDFFLT